MKPLATQSDNAAGGEDHVAQVLATVPVVMRAIRKEMRCHRPTDLSVPQFRAMGLIYRHGGISLSHVAEHMEITLPTVSRMVDLLVKRGFVVRETSADDRRRLMLRLTDEGSAAYEEADRRTRARLAEALKALSPAERHEVTRAMQALRRIFGRAE